jgi:hypothetical protein
MKVTGKEGRTMQYGTRIALGLLLLVASCGTLGADDGRWSIRLDGNWVEPDADPLDTEEGNGYTLRVSSSDAVGFGLSAEYRFSPAVGVSFGFVYSEPAITLKLESDAGATDTATDDLRFLPVIVGLPIHLSSKKSVDFQVAPLLAYVHYGDLAFTLGGDSGVFDSSGDIAVGLELGIDIRLGESAWSLYLGIRYLRTEVEATERGTGDVNNADFDPAFGVVGARYRF